MTLYQSQIGATEPYRVVLDTTASTIIIPADPNNKQEMAKVTIANVTFDGTTVFYLFRNVPVPVGGLPLEFRDETLQLGETLRVKASVAGALHVSAHAALPNRAPG